MQNAGLSGTTPTLLANGLIPLLFCMAVLVAALLLLARKGRGGPVWPGGMLTLAKRAPRQLVLAEKIQVGPNQTIVLLQAFNREIVAGIGPSGWTVLMENQPFPPPSQPEHFRVHLDRVAREQGANDR